MKIELAEHSGFCMGVRDAILKIVKELNASSEEILVFGQLIHNPQTTEILKKRGLNTIKDLDCIDNKIVVIRTHGIPVNDLKEIKNRARLIYNLTCPRVLRVQGLIKQYSGKGYFTIIIGDKDHAEVIGLKSYASSGVAVVSDIKDIKKIPDAEKYIIVSQTTQDKEQFNMIADNIKLKHRDVTVFNTICESTNSRQDDIRQGIKNNIDALVVVGGKHSANTMRLAQISRESSIKTFHIETESELQEKDFTKVNHVLVTAGASTPGWIINNVIEKLYEINYKKGTNLKNLFLKFINIIIRTNLLSGIVAFFITLFTENYIGQKIDLIPALISFLYIFAMYTLNNFFEMEFLLIRNPVKYSIQYKYRNIIVPVSIASLLLSFALIARYDLPVIIIYSASALLGTIYSTNSMNRFVQGFNFPAIYKLYNLKNIVSSFGWVISTIIIPATIFKANTNDIFAISIFIFTVVLIRNILFDIIAFQGDLIFGKQSLPTIFGVKKTQRLALIISAFTGITYAAVTIYSGNYKFLVFLINLLYISILFLKISSNKYFITLKHDLLVDFNLAIFILLCLICLC